MDKGFFCHNCFICKDIEVWTALNYRVQGTVLTDWMSAMFLRQTVASNFRPRREQRPITLSGPYTTIVIFRFCTHRRVAWVYQSNRWFDRSEIGSILVILPPRLRVTSTWVGLSFRVGTLRSITSYSACWNADCVNHGQSFRVFSRDNLLGGISKWKVENDSRENTLVLNLLS